MNNHIPAESQTVLPSENVPIFTPNETLSEENPVRSDRIDLLFSILYLFVGYGFISISSGADVFRMPRNFALFTVLYAMIVSFYVLAKRKRVSKESLFWLIILLFMGISYAFWSVMPLLQMMAVIVTAAYWTLSTSGRLMNNNRTSQWIVFDLFNALAVVPFRNFFCHFKILLCLNHSSEDIENEKRQKYKTFLYAGLGLLISVPVLFIILPLLSSADEGFSQLLAKSGLYIQDRFVVIFVKFLLSIPVTFFLYGLVYGCIQGRNTNCFSKTTLQKSGLSLHFVPDAAVYSALLVICVTYLIFIGLQGSYLFSAFAGIRPETFTYAEYARRGFFELCQIAALNLMLILSAHFFSKTEVSKNKILRFINILLSVLTLLLIATAMSKMMMYIQVFGLTVKRILTMVFMLWLLITYVMVIVRQKKHFDLTRIAIICGAILFCLLCIIPVEHCIEWYNLWAGK